jgi:hypothetical protein
MCCKGDGILYLQGVQLAVSCAIEVYCTGKGLCRRTALQEAVLLMGVLYRKRARPGCTIREVLHSPHWPEL